MGKETERKFLVAGDYRKEAKSCERIAQGYLSSAPERTVRVRIKGERGFITVKGPGSRSGATRFEWEKEIPAGEAAQLLELCGGRTIEKTRYRVPAGKHVFEVDEFLGDNAGLTLAEIELESEDEEFERPLWLGREVTGDIRYYNSYLASGGTRQTAGISPSEKLADLISSDYRLLDVLSRLGIGLGFGEDTIGQACESHGINTDSFILICGEYAFDSYMASSALLAKGSPADVMKYLHNSHLCYREKEMPALEAELRTLMEPTGEARRRTVANFFNDYRDEMARHFEYEENTVFPYIRSRLSGENSGNGYSIGQFGENHTDIVEKLGDLKNIVMKYLPAECNPVLRNNVLYRIFRLEEDLRRHTLIEDNILIPMTMILESHD